MKDVEGWGMLRKRGGGICRGSQREKETDTESKGDINKWSGEAAVWMHTHRNVKRKMHAEMSNRHMERERKTKI